MAGALSLTRLSLKGAYYHRRAHMYVLISAAVGTAVITGALLVGDSMRGSLSDRVRERLGSFDYAITGSVFFREGLAGDLRLSPAASAAVPVISLRGSVRHAETGLRSGTANILGVNEGFWAGWGKPNGPPSGLGEALTGRRAVLNATAARAVGASPGDSILIYTESAAEIPAEYAFGRRAEPPPALRLEVDRVLPDEGLAIFDLENGQRTPPNVFVPRGLLEAEIGKKGRSNVILLRGATETDPSGKGAPLSILARTLEEAWTLEDAGLSLRRDDDLGYVSLESRELLLPPAAVDAARSARLRATPGAERLGGAMTYLANALVVGERETPYSTVCAVGEWTPLGGEGQRSPIFARRSISQGQIILNDWTAEDLDAKEGDHLGMTFYVVGEDHALREERARFTVAGVVPLEGWAKDPRWTPDYPGISDANSMRGWTPPFEIDLKRIRVDKDEAYWDEYRATPKAFVSLEDGERLWASRFGRLTSVRFRDPGGRDLESLEADLRKELREHVSPASSGVALRSVKEEGLRAATGATDFSGLFLALSFFLIASSLILLSMVFRLAMLRRSREFGILAATGFSGRKILALLLLEASWTVLWGTFVGLLGAVGYAALLLEGLRTVWKDAVSAPFLELHLGAASLIGGGIGTAFLAIVTTLAVSRKVARTDPRELLALQGRDPPAGPGRRLRARLPLAISGLAGALAIGVVVLGALRLAFRPQVAFFLGGGLLLVAGLSFADWVLRRPGHRLWLGHRTIALGRLGVGYAGRSPGRSLLTIALISSATFVLVSVAASRIGGHHGGPSRESGDGGFALVGRCAVPLTASLGSASGRASLGLSPETSEILEAGTVFSFRVRPGEDASCLNLYRPRSPTLLGAPRRFLERGGFPWAGSLAETAPEKENPWLVLERDLPDGAIPAVGDANTVTWILHSGLGRDLEILDDRGVGLTLRIVGVVAGSIFQGELLLSERHFLERFPRVSGNAFFLFEASPARVQGLTRGLENDLSDLGFDVETTAAVLEAYESVANTYVSAFQALGGLGLLLGTVGLGAILARNTVERRSEFALLGALGYSPRALGWIVLSETIFLLLAGLSIGSLAPILCLLPVTRGGTGGISLLGMGIALLCVFAAGLISSQAALRGAMRSPLIPSLREE